MSTSNLKFKHLSSSDRTFIESALNCGDTFKSIALALGKDPTTISKEVKRNLITKHPTRFGSLKNLCINVRSCSKEHTCTHKQMCNKSCSSCNDCFTSCSKFHYIECEKLSKPPYVCNPCNSKSKCRELKRMYSAYEANSAYIKLRSESRVGLNISKSKFEAIDKLVSSLIINNNLSINHIVSNNKDIITTSTRTIYRYFESNILSASSFDLPRKLNFKPRKVNKPKSEIKFTYLEGRRYSDFIEYTNLNPMQEVIEIDCVEGSKGSSVLLTMLFRDSSLMLIFKLQEHKAESVNNTIRSLIKTVGKVRFKKYFPIILTDRGSEFKRLHEIEFDKNGMRLTNVFYCDPNCSYQKGKLEKNHTLIRMVYPKGKCLDNVNEDDISSLMNNINNYSREIYCGKSPYEIFNDTKPVKLVSLLGQNKIAPNKVCLRAKSK